MATYEASQLEVQVQFKSEDSTGAKNTYKATIVFDGVDDAVKCGARFVTWTLQRFAREGKLPHDREIRVNSKGEFEKSDEEIVAALTPAQIAAVLAAHGKKANK